MAQVRNKIGLHVGPGGNMTGLGEWERRLDAAGIPFCLKSADHYGPLFEAAQIARASGVAHTMAFRLSTAGQNDGFDYDVPDYELAPAAAADKHWRRTKEKLPPEYDRELVWLEPINEVDKGRADWLGHFAAEIGALALQDGLKVALFGWSSGEPEPADWQTEGMLRYLRFCAEHPDRAAVALHEYSYKVDDIWFMRDFQVGRFQQLFQVCDRHLIRRPKVIITEWGWTYENVPGPEQALADIRAVGAMYGAYPEVLGAAIWYLGGGFQGVANRAQPLIEPLAQLTLSELFEVPDSPAGDVPGGVITPDPDAAGEDNCRFITDVTIPDFTRLPAGARFTKVWRVQNSGDRPWGAGYALAYAGGDPMTEETIRPLPAAAPGQVVDLSLDLKAPADPGLSFSDWRCRNPAGQLFGDVVFTKIVVEERPTAAAHNARFVADLTIPDDSTISGDTAFTKTWQVQNTGETAWGGGQRLVFLRGTPMTDRRETLLPVTQPGQLGEVSIDLRAPSTPGTYWADWRFQDEAGNFFGDLVFVRIIVPRPASRLGIVPLHQCDPQWGESRLGNSLSDLTICRWGCLLTAFTMVANAYGKALTPIELNRRIVRGPGFINNNLTPWNVLGKLYEDVVYVGKQDLATTPDLLAQVNAALARGEAVVAQVDTSPNNPYNPDSDQHWVLITGREGDDYTAYDPLSGQEISLLGVYGRPDTGLSQAILAAITYRSTSHRLDYGLLGPPAHRPLMTGMNVNPDAPHSDPSDGDAFKGLDWARFVFKADARQRSVEEAFAQYDPIVRSYAEQGVGSLLILNQETIWDGEPWNGSGDWAGYAGKLAAAAGEIAAHYAGYGGKIAFETWNEGDLPDNPASVFVPPDQFAHILGQTAAAIRGRTTLAPIIFGGLASGPGAAIDYVRRCREALGGRLPVDALGIHPYGRWATRAPFDWGQHFGTLGSAIAEFRAAFPELPLWITEIGVAADETIGPQHYPAIADYLLDVYQTVGQRYVREVPAVIWFAWSDWMRNAGIVDSAGQPKSLIYPVFKAIRSRELDQFGLA